MDKHIGDINEMVKKMENWAYRNGMLWHEGHAKSLAEALLEKYQQKIPEGAVVLTDDELNEVIDTCKVSMIVTDDDGEKYISLDDHNEYTERLGKIARQRKARIEQLEKLLDDRCDRCIERERKGTAEKFAQRLKADVSEDNELHEALNAYLKRDYFEYIDEICKEFTGDKDEKG